MCDMLRTGLNLPSKQRWAEMFLDGGVTGTKAEPALRYRVGEDEGGNAARAETMDVVECGPGALDFTENVQ